ncbi:hypothetical protein ACLB1E_28575 [Escherichia coli]
MTTATVDCRDRPQATNKNDGGFQSLPDALASQRLTVALSKSTKAMFTAFRQVVPFVSQDPGLYPGYCSIAKILRWICYKSKIKSLLIVYHNIHRYDK